MEIRELKVISAPGTDTPNPYPYFIGLILKFSLELI
jgi:hypothetical protein